MEEKYMVNDILEEIKLKLIKYQNAITQTENLKLRQTFQKVRDNEESFQYEVLRIAQVKGYYKSAEKVTQNYIDKIKNDLQDWLQLQRYKKKKREKKRKYEHP